MSDPLQNLTAEYVLTLDELAAALGYTHRSELSTIVGGQLIIRSLDSLAIQARGPHGELLDRIAWLNERWSSALARALSPTGDVRRHMEAWTGSRGLRMSWLPDELCHGFRMHLLNVLLRDEAPVVDQRRIHLPEARLLSAISLQLELARGTSLEAAERKLEEAVARARGAIAEARKAWGPVPRVSAERLFQWGEWTCRHLVFAESFRSIARDVFAGEVDPAKRATDVSSGIRKARASLEADPVPENRVVSFFAE